MIRVSKCGYCAGVAFSSSHFHRFKISASGAAIEESAQHARTSMLKGIAESRSFSPCTCLEWNLSFTNMQYCSRQHRHWQRCFGTHFYLCGPQSSISRASHRNSSNSCPRASPEFHACSCNHADAHQQRRCQPRTTAW